MGPRGLHRIAIESQVSDMGQGAVAADTGPATAAEDSTGASSSFGDGSKKRKFSNDQQF